MWRVCGRWRVRLVCCGASVETSDMPLVLHSSRPGLVSPGAGRRSPTAIQRLNNASCHEVT